MRKSEYKYVMTSERSKRRHPRPNRAWTVTDLEAYAVRYVARFDCTEQRLRSVLTRQLKARAENDAEPANHALLTSIDRLIDRFKELGYVDDQRFAERLVESLRSKGASTRKIRERMRTRGVSPEVQANLMGARATRDEELAAAVTWVKRKRLGAHRPVEQQRANLQRDLAALGRAGFSFDVARRALALAFEVSE